MVFPSLSPYADPPNWNQQHQAHHHHHHHASVGGAVGVDSGGGGRSAAGRGTASFRPGSTEVRTRLVKIPHTEHTFKCPRCDSTNTKFCYFNNYSFSQPRHFCKACRRYWTRGGALRNVPVGGGCRRNKRGKSGGGGSSSDRSSGNHRSGAGASSSGAVGGAMASGASLPPPLPPPAAPAATPHPIADYRNVLVQIQQFPMMLGGAMEPLLPQPPLLAPLPSLLFSSFGEEIEDVQDRSKELMKTEQKAQEQLGLPRLYLGDNSKSNVFWGGGDGGGDRGASNSSGWATSYFSTFNSSLSGDNNFM